MKNLASSMVFPFVSSSSGYDAPPLSSNPAVPRKPELRMRGEGNSSVTSVAFIGEPYWRTRAPALISLEAASKTPSIIKRGFEYMYHKAHGYRLRGGSLYFGPVPNLARKSQRDVPSYGVAPTRLDSDTALPLRTKSISPDPQEKHNSTIAIGICSDSAKKVLKVAPLISLEEARRREVSRRNRAADRALGKEIQIEREVSRLKREVAEIVRKKAQAKCEEETIARLEKDSQAKKTLETVENRKREESPTLTAAVAAREGGLVVAPTNWIVPLISLDEARHTEKAKRDAAEIKSPVPPPSPPPSAVTSLNSLAINAGNGNTATLRLISLEEARGRDRIRRLEEDVASRARMPAQVGTGLSHVSLIPLSEARKQDAIRRNRSSHNGNKPKPPSSMSRSHKPSYPSPSKDTSAPQEKARWLTLMSDAENWQTRPNPVPAYP